MTAFFKELRGFLGEFGGPLVGFIGIATAIYLWASMIAFDMRTSRACVMAGGAYVVPQGCVKSLEFIPFTMP